jgi:hypothetical protein
MEISSPQGSLVVAPIACDGFITLGLWLNGSIIIPFAVVAQTVPMVCQDLRCRSRFSAVVAAQSPFACAKRNVFEILIFNFQYSLI